MKEARPFARGNSEVTTHKFAVVLNKKVELPILMNALAHCTVSLMDRLPEELKTETGVMSFLDADGNDHPLSKNSYVILRADNGNKIRTTRKGALEDEVSFADFTDTTYLNTYLDQVEQTKKTKEEDLEYFAIALFGEKEKVEELTRKFSLWR
jgi:hypothetical protein